MIGEMMLTNTQLRTLIRARFELNRFMIYKLGGELDLNNSAGYVRNPILDWIS